MNRILNRLLALGCVKSVDTAPPRKQGEPWHVRLVCGRHVITYSHRHLRSALRQALDDALSEQSLLESVSNSTRADAMRDREEIVWHA